jgi:L-asparaginase
MTTKRAIPLVRTRFGPGRTLLLLAALALPAQLAAQPAVHVIATGGTISNTGTAERRTGTELVDGLPGIERVATVTVEQFSNVASGAITLEQWRALALRIGETFRAQPELAGIVVTHGTDTMEETAYFLELTVSDCRPVVVTGAMRRATHVAPDGPANLFNAIRLAAAPAASRLGAVVLMDDRIFPAREVTKINTVRTDAFAAPGAGALGVADADALIFHREPVSRRCGRTPFDVAAMEALPRVEIIYAYQGADGALIRAAVEAGARGIVMAGMGQGAVTPGQSAALREAAQAGVFVVYSNRTGSGRVPIGRGGAGTTLGADDLTPQKSRILLMLALAADPDPAAVRRVFETY